jgi:hypothetical protein
MARIIVEQVFTEAFSDKRYAEFAKAVDPCLEVRSGVWRRSSLSKDKLRLTCEFEAPDAESVREAFRTAGVPFERVWAADVFAVEDYPERMSKLQALLDRQAKSAT